MVSSGGSPRWFSLNGFFRWFSTLVLTKGFLPVVFHVGSHKMVSSSGSPRWFSQDGFFRWFSTFVLTKWFISVVLHVGSHKMVSSNAFPRWFSSDGFFQWIFTWHLVWFSITDWFSNRSLCWFSYMNIKNGLSNGPLSWSSMPGFNRTEQVNCLYRIYSSVHNT